MSFHPDQRLVTSMTTARRRVVLPEEAIGSLDVHEGKRVDLHDVIAKGMIPARHVIVEGASFFGLRKAENLRALMLVSVGDVVDVRQVLAGKSPKRGKRLFSPVSGIIAQVSDGRIIIQEMPELVKLEAGTRGRVVEILPRRGVVIETMGAVIQGVWGNGRRAIANLRFEPEEGLENMISDGLDMQRTGSILVTQRPIHAISIHIMQDQGYGGIIAPSMDANLREEALKADGAVMLTEGFGAMRMSNLIYSTLIEFDGNQVMLDAATPVRWASNRPEVIIPRHAEERPPTSTLMLPARPGLNVRVTCAPYAGLTGRIIDLPKTPCLLDNGLHVQCARIEFITGETASVPLADLEYYGK